MTRFEIKTYYVGPVYRNGKIWGYDTGLYPYMPCFCYHGYHGGDSAKEAAIESRNKIIAIYLGQGHEVKEERL